MMNTILSKDDWMRALDTAETSLTINTCRCDVLKTDWCIPEKQMDEHLLLFVESGTLHARLNGTASVIEPGTFVWVLPGDYRELSGDSKVTPLRYYKLRFNLHSGDNQLSMKPIPTRPQSWAMFPLFQLLAAEYNSDSSWRTEQQLRHLLSIFCTAYFRLVESAASTHALSVQQRAFVDDFIASNLDQHLSSADLARELRLSQDYFSRLFVKEFGQTPRRYIKRARIRYAASRLTESPLTIKELAAEMGYNNVNLFCRQFKEIMSMTPTQYRQRYI